MKAVPQGHLVELRSYGLGFVNNPMDRAFFIGTHITELLYPGDSPQGLKPGAAGPLVRLPSAAPLSASTALHGTQFALTPTFVGFDLGRVHRDVIRIPANQSIIITKRSRHGSSTSEYSIHP